MTRAYRFGMIGIFAIGAIVTPAFSGSVTVGRFYTELAQAKRLAAADAASAEASLRAAGFNLPKLALGKSLTEGDMTSISTVLGLAVKTEQPSQTISEAELNVFMASFGSQIGVSASPIGEPGKVDPFALNDHGHSKKSKGKGKKKGHHKSPHGDI